MPQPLPPPERTRATRWSGPALVALGLLILAALLVPGVRAGNALAAWIVQEALAPARVLALVGIGFAVGLDDGRRRIAALLLAAGGLALGFLFYRQLLDPLWVLPRAAENRFLTGPALAFAAGAPLVCPMRWRAALLPACAFMAALALALGIVAGDPSLTGVRYSLSAVLVALWIAVSAALCARACVGRGAAIASRIFGSWLMAMGILYGAAALAPPQ